MSTGPFDVHAAAIAAVGQASVLDASRVRTTDRNLIGNIAAALKKSELRSTTHDVVEAVKAHYQHADTVVTGEAIVAIIRRRNLLEFRAHEAERRDYLDERGRADMAEEWANIRTWPCSTCGAGWGEFCHNRITGELFGKNPPGHAARIVAAYRGQTA